jgi:hypothetical protein
MAMKPQLVQLLEAMKAQNLKPMHELSPADARKQMADSAKARSTTLIKVGNIEDRSIPGPAVNPFTDIQTKCN